MFAILYGTFLILLTITTVSLLFYLIYSLIIYLYNIGPLLIELYKDYRFLKNMENEYIKYYKKNKST